MTDKQFPNPEEVQKEFEDFVKQRFGGSVQVFTNHVNSFDEKEDEQSPTEDIEETSFNIDFNLKPKEVKDYLDQYVIKQDEAKKALSIAICDHYNHVKNCLNGTYDQEYTYAKQNVLVLGPTGVGKTYLVRKIAELIGVPFVKADATRFSETGYVGANVDDLVRDLVNQADGDIEKAQYGIVYLDEADKIASPQNSQGRDVNGRGVQFGLLRLMEETEIDLRSGNDMQSQMQALMEMQSGKSSKKIVNTGNILFIVSGAFTGLDEIIRKRLRTTTIGFNTSSEQAQLSAEELYSNVTTQDLVDFGFEPEFVGRLPVRVSCETLKTNDLYHILKDSKGSIINQYKYSFRSWGIKTEFEDSALRRIADLAHRENTGARGLMTICEQALRIFKYELPSTLVKDFKINKDLIDNPTTSLRQILSQEKPSIEYETEIRTFETSFFEKHGIKISFDKEASALLVGHSIDKKLPISILCEELLQSYEHGLKLVSENINQQDFVLNKEVINNPKIVLEKLVKDSYVSRSQSNELKIH